MTISESAGVAESQTAASLAPRPRPVVGIATPQEQAAWRIWTGPALLLTPGYPRHVRTAGGVPVMLPVGGDVHEADDVLARIDGLVIAGGADVHPGVYGRDPHPAAGPFDPERDRWERDLVSAAVELGIPILGICRGMQLINVVLGGSLVQHLPDAVGTDLHCPTPGKFSLHQVRTDSGSRLRHVVGDVLDVPTYHHQAVDQLAPGLTAVAWAEDGTIEALEDASGLIFAVQWHPEVADANAVFGQFVRRCAEFRLAKDSTPPIDNRIRQASRLSQREDYVWMGH